MNSQLGRKLIAWRRVRKLLNCILAGCVSIALTFGNCISGQPGCFGSPLQSVNKASGTAQVNKDAVDLEVGKPIERELKNREIHTYKVKLNSGEFLRLVVDQRGIDVVVTMFNPDGKQIIEVDSPNGSKGPEPVSLVTEASGAYQLEVRSLEESAPAGKYEVKIEELRKAIPQDSTQIAADKAFAQADQFRLEGTAESLRKAIEKYDEVLAMMRVLGNHQAEALTLTHIGRVYELLRENGKALDYYNQALSAWRKVGDRRFEGIILHNIGSVYDSLGERQRALEYYNHALPISIAVADRKLEATVLNNIALVQDMLGEKQKALDYYYQVLPITRASGDRQLEATAISNIGSVYEWLGEKQRALEYFNQALPISTAVGDRRGQAATLHNIAGVYNSLGEKQKALDYFNRALPIIRAAGDRRGEAFEMVSIGTVYYSLGEEQKALDFYKQALPIIRAVGDRRLEAATLLNVGISYDSPDSSQKALEYLNQSLYLSRSVSDHSTEARTLYWIAQAKQHQGSLAEARTNVESALNIIESLRIKVASPELRSSYFSSMQEYYDYYIDLLMQLHHLEPKQGHDALALQASESARA